MATTHQADDLEQPIPALSVVVCTYNRADLLSHALQSLCAQTAEASRYELIVVDNNSRDNTRETVEGFASRYPVVRYCLEQKQGLSHARNRGWEEACGKYVAYVDDDCTVPDDWVATALAIMKDPSPAVFGGPHYGAYHAPQPRWWKEQYGSFEPAQASGALGPGDYLQGNNIVIQRELLAAIGGFDSRYGMVGDTIAYAEETELQKRIRASCPDAVIHYDPQLFVHHLVRPEKMTLRWNVVSHFSCGRYSCRLLEDDSPQPSRPQRLKLVGRAMITVLQLVGGLGLALFRRDRNRFPCIENYIYETSFMHIYNLGVLYGRCIDTTGLMGSDEGVPQQGADTCRR
jgi:GT2 family glycosyltransferase